MPFVETLAGGGFCCEEARSIENAVTGRVTSELAAQDHECFEECGDGGGFADLIPQNHLDHG
jgi:hypothetical protein